MNNVIRFQKVLLGIAITTVGIILTGIGIISVFSRGHGTETGEMKAIISGCGPSVVTESDQITQFIRNTDWPIDQKLTMVRNIVAFLPPDTQREMIKEADLSKEEEQLVIKYCIYTEDEYQLLLKYFEDPENEQVSKTVLSWLDALRGMEIVEP